MPTTGGGALRLWDPAGSVQRGPGQSRQALLRSATVAWATLATGGGLLAQGAHAAASAPSPSEDVRVLNFVLLIEYVQAEFYREASAHSGLGSELVEYAKVVGGHEDEHVAALRQALGAKARRRPAMDFGPVTSNRRRFLSAAIELEDLGVAAYNGQAANLTSKALVPAAEIVSVEARHAAWIRAIAGELPATGPTDAPRSSKAVIAALVHTGFVKGLKA
jgi:Ferritin-like domain